MGWIYAKATGRLPIKMGLYLFLQVIFVACVMTVALHAPFWSEEWQMGNGHFLRWDLGLLRIWATANCDTYNLRDFHAVCMAVFKNSYGTIDEVKNFICSLDRIPLNMEAAYMPSARVFVNSCEDVRRIFTTSTMLLSMWLVAAAFTAGSFVCLFRLAYEKFLTSAKKWYWLALFMQLFAGLLLLATLIIYPNELKETIPSVWNYYDTVNAGSYPIRRVAHGSSTYGIGFWMGIAITFLAGVLVVLHIMFIPIVRTSAIVRRSQPNNESYATSSSGPVESKSKKDVFWAYMPEVFQPDIYIAEVGGDGSYEQQQQLFQQQQQLPPGMNYT